MRIAWNLIAVVCVGLGTIGWFVPGMPSTVFYIIALYGFTVGGNEKARQKLLNHKYVGESLRHWEEHRSISRRIKWVACSCIAISCTISAVLTPPIWAKALIIYLGMFGVWYVLSRRTTEDIHEESPLVSMEAQVNSSPDMTEFVSVAPEEPRVTRVPIPESVAR